MDELIKQLQLSSGDISGVFTLWEVLISIVLSFMLCLVIGMVYRVTHRGVSYSQSFVQTMVIMAVVVSLIMLIIGSNIARAFSLVGALSIIRFRNAVKESRDVGFIFFAMGIGMACGTRFYALAILATFVISALVYLMHRFNFGEKPSFEKILKVYVPENMDYHHVFDNVFYRYLAEYSLLSVETVRQGVFLELIYSVQFKKGVSEKEFMDEIRVINGNAKVAIVQGMQNINI